MFNFPPTPFFPYGVPRELEEENEGNDDDEEYEEHLIEKEKKHANREQKREVEQ